jgi:hypothetical protein
LIVIERLALELFGHDLRAIFEPAHQGQAGEPNT